MYKLIFFASNGALKLRRRIDKFVEKHAAFAWGSLLLAALCVVTFLVLACLPTDELQNFDGYVIIERVIDGDTVVLENGEKVRLYGVDTPEKYEKGYAEATEFTRNYTKGSIRITRMGLDKYGRTVAILSKKGGATLNGELVHHGHAEILWQYCKAKICKNWEK